VNAVSECVRLKAQHDSDSCGVYCVAVAFDRMSDIFTFASAGTVGKPASAQLRVRILWRILYDSRRSDPFEDNAEVAHNLGVSTHRMGRIH
jgi:hypothetical protein